MTQSHSQLLSSVKSVWIQSPGNETVSSIAQTVLRRAMYDECHAFRNITPASAAALADLIIKSRLVTYSNKAISFSSVDRAKEYRLTIEVELEVTRRGESKLLWKGSIQASKDYPANSDLALQHDSEDSALEAASRIIAQKCLVSIEQTF